MALETRLAAGHWDKVTNRDPVKTYTLVDLAGLAEMGPGIDWLALPRGARCRPGGLRRRRRPPARPRPLDGRRPGRGAGRGVARLARLARRARAGALPVGRRRRGELRLLRAHPVRGAADAGALEARGRPGRGGARRGGRAALRRAALPAARQGAHGRARRQPRRGLPAQPVRRCRGWATTPAARRWPSSASSPPRSATRSAGATTPPSRSVPATCSATSGAPSAFEVDRQLAKLGGPVDRDEWFMTPQTVNAYYNPGLNEIVFPAAILQPPFFDVDADDAVNYGGIGAVIGHEVGHGFDDQGSQFDGTGTLRNWWTERGPGGVPGPRRRAHRPVRPARDPRRPGPQGQRRAHRRREHRRPRRASPSATRPTASRSATSRPPSSTGTPASSGSSSAGRRSGAGCRGEAEAERLLALDPHSPMDLRANAVRNLTEFHEAFGVRRGRRDVAGARAPGAHLLTARPANRMPCPPDRSSVRSPVWVPVARLRG